MKKITSVLILLIAAVVALGGSLFVMSRSFDGKFDKLNQMNSVYSFQIDSLNRQLASDRRQILMLCATIDSFSALRNMPPVAQAKKKVKYGANSTFVNNDKDLEYFNKYIENEKDIVF